MVHKFVPSAWPCSHPRTMQYTSDLKLTLQPRRIAVFNLYQRLVFRPSNGVGLWMFHDSHFSILRMRTIAHYLWPYCRLGCIGGQAATIPRASRCATLSTRAIAPTQSKAIDRCLWCIDYRESGRQSEVSHAVCHDMQTTMELNAEWKAALKMTSWRSI